MTRDEIQARVIGIVSECGEIPVEKLRADVSLHRYGIDSVAGVNIAYEIGMLLGRDVPSTLVTEHDTINKLVSYIDDGAGPRS